MDQWKPILHQHAMSLFNLPSDLAHSPDYHFYKPLDFEYESISRFRFLGIIRPAKKYDYIIFRCWVIDESLMTSDLDILAPDGSGRIDLNRSEVDDLKVLLRSYGHTIRDIREKKPMFQRIAPEDYEKFQIDTTYMYGKQHTKIYLCDPESEPCVDDHHQGMHKILGITVAKQKTSIRTTFTPKEKDRSFQFHNGWLIGQGWLNLTKRGIEEFCQLLEAE